MMGYFLALIPAYLFVYLPITQILYGPSPSSHDDTLPFNMSFIAPDEPGFPDCQAWKGGAHILSREPLVLYLENWLEMDEAAHLSEISTPLYAPSTTLTSNNVSTDPTIRLSDVATPPRTPTVRCLEARARALQGWDDGLMIERLKMQRYTPQGHYVHHFDWAGLARGGHASVDRVSSFLVWVKCSAGDSEEEQRDHGNENGSCKGGGTEFPRLKMRARQRRELCQRGWIACPELGPTSSPPSPHGDVGGGEEGLVEGVVFMPVPGNAIFWENLRKDGSGYDETWHAGLPLESGVKVGLNIWTWARF